MFLKSIVFMGLLLHCLACSAKQLVSEIVLIPEGYIGRLVIMYGVSGGSPVEYEGDAHVIRFDARGGHATELSIRWDSRTPGSSQFFYVDRDEKRTPVLDKTEISVPVLETSDGRKLSSVEFIMGSEDIDRAAAADPNVYIIASNHGYFRSADCIIHMRSYYVGSNKNLKEGKGNRSILEYNDLIPCNSLPAKESANDECQC